MADFTDPAPANVVRIPEWDDVLQITPRRAVSSRARKAWTEYMRAHELTDVPVSQLRQRLDPIYDAGDQVAGISADELDTILDGREKYQALRGSAIPGWRQQMIKVLTVLDNVEDQVSTIEWATRPVTRLWAPTKWLSRVARRTNDVISDVESVLAGPSIAKFRAKDRAARANRRTARAASGKAGKLAQFVQALGSNKGQILEAGQAMHTWTGYGIQLGAIFGALEETQDRFLLSAWHGAKASVALAAKAFAPAGGELEEILDGQINDDIDQVRRYGVPLLDQIKATPNALAGAVNYFGELARTLGAAALLQTENDTYTRAQHALALYHVTAWTPLLASALEKMTSSTVLARAGELEEPQPHVRDSYSRDLLLEAGATLTYDGRPSGIWQSPTRSLRAAIDANTARALEATSTWLPNTDDELEHRLLHALTESAGLATGYTITGREDGLHLIPDPAIRAVVLMHHLDAAPPRGTSRKALEAWLADQVTAIQSAPDSYNWRDWIAVTARHWPIDHLTPLRQSSGEGLA